MLIEISPCLNTTSRRLLWSSEVKIHALCHGRERALTGHICTAVASSPLQRRDAHTELTAGVLDIWSEEEILQELDHVPSV